MTQRRPSTRSRSRIARLRMPVVVTLALGAAAPGCGGTTDGGARGALEGECPEASPGTGDSCSYEGPACEYDLCGSYPTRSATCVDGAWSVAETSCNPPPPPETECPLEKPVFGEGCSYEGPTCDYDRCYGAHFTYHATCADGAWSIGHTSCNPPPPTCPEVPPTEGTACSGSGGCSYPVPCGPEQVFYCRGYVWALQVGVSGAPFDPALPPGCFPPVDAGAPDAPGDAGPGVPVDQDGGGAEPVPAADAGVD